MINAPMRGSRWMNRWGVIALLFVVAGCAWYARHELDEHYGPADPARYDRPRADAAAGTPWQDAQGVLDRRCVVCHGWYDAPCQLQLGSHAGVTRGANKEAVYATRLSAAEPTRLFVDAHSNIEWRNQGFYPVLNEREPTADANREGGLLYRYLAMKRTLFSQPLRAWAGPCTFFIATITVLVAGLAWCGVLRTLTPPAYF